MSIDSKLFSEFVKSPKMAWFHVNDEQQYNQIQGVEGEEDAEGGEETQSSIQTQLFELLGKKGIVSLQGDATCEIAQTLQTIQTKPKIIYKPSFQFGDLVVTCDFLVRNNAGSYDLIVAKQKNNIRQTQKQKPLRDSIAHDASFQHYVLSKVLGKKFSGKCIVAYLNKDYVGNGTIDNAQLIKQEDITAELLSHDAIEQIATRLKSQLAQTKITLEKNHPYNNESYMEYFGAPAPDGSIWQIPGIGNRKKTLYELGKTDIMGLGDDEKKLLLSAKNEPTKASKYVEKYQQAETVIDKERIREKLSGLQYPLFFYDYETIASPTPLFNGTKPLQMSVVQYSVHRVDKDGSITHKEFLLKPGSKDLKSVVEGLYSDLQGGAGTYIVWYKGFENNRNIELAQLYPEYKDFLKLVNERTFDLMEIFSELDYFDRRFKGSSSIKKVLPVMTGITYDALEISNGGDATAQLLDMFANKMPATQVSECSKNLLQYCEQDTFAMIRIWQELRKAIA